MKEEIVLDLGRLRGLRVRSFVIVRLQQRLIVSAHFLRSTVHPEMINEGGYMKKKVRSVFRKFSMLFVLAAFFALVSLISSMTGAFPVRADDGGEGGGCTISGKATFVGPIATCDCAIVANTCTCVVPCGDN